MLCFQIKDYYSIEICKANIIIDSIKKKDIKTPSCINFKDKDFLSGLQNSYLLKKLYSKSMENIPSCSSFTRLTVLLEHF